MSSDHKSNEKSTTDSPTKSYTDDENEPNDEDLSALLFKNTSNNSGITMVTEFETALHDDSDVNKSMLTAKDEVSEQKNFSMMNESTVEIFYQTSIPFLLAGLGSITSGLLMNRVQKVELVCEVPEFIAICTPLQAMKGNLDMTFTSRLGTMAHKGRLRKHPGRLKCILRNIALMQAQVVFISLFATFITFTLDALAVRSMSSMPVANFLFLGSNSLFAMSTASAISSNGMFIVVLIAYKLSINPDNVATPLASGCGDLMTILAMFQLLTGMLYFPYSSFSIAVPLSVIAIFLALVPLWLRIAYQDEQAWIAARQQGATLLLASILSSGAGIVQARGAVNFPELTVYQPLITGNAGNRASLQSARIGSYLHTYKGPNRLRLRPNPWTYYTSSDNESKVARYLLISAIPFQALFVLTSYAVAKIALKPLNLNIVFFIGYLFTVSIQIFILVYLSQVLVYGLFHFGIDPDMHAIPLLTSVGDLLGTSLLFALFCVLSYGEELLTRPQAAANMLTNATITCLYE